MSESNKPSTGYSVCQAMVSVLEAEVVAMKARQRRRELDDDFSGPVNALSRAISSMQQEIRRTGDDADKAVNNLPAERQVQLILKAIREMSPEHRLAIQIYCDELGSKL